jgi:hypothetical protein
MSISKTLTLPGGSFSINESGGNAVLEIKESESIGGGTAAGFLQIEGDGKVTLTGKQMMDIAFAYIESKLPSAAALIAKEVQAFADAEIGNI